MNIFKKLFGGDPPGEPPEFAALLEECMQGLGFLTSSHQSVWRIDQAEKWDLEQDIGDLVFTFPDGIVKAPAQIIGSFDTTTCTWLWGWANPSVDEFLKRDALQVLEYGRQHRIARLTTAEWQAEEIDGWHMTALATCICRANGAYRGPAGTMFVFMTFGEVTGSLSDGKLVIDIKEPVEDPAPDFSQVTSEKAALKLASEGKLVKMLMMPELFSGADRPENVVYVPSRILKKQDQISRTIISLLEKGLTPHFSCKPEFKGNSFVPAKLHYKASHPETNWHFERTIDIW